MIHRDPYYETEQQLRNREIREMERHRCPNCGGSDFKWRDGGEAEAGTGYRDGGGYVCECGEEIDFRHEIRTIEVSPMATVRMREEMEAKQLEGKWRSQLNMETK